MTRLLEKLIGLLKRDPEYRLAKGLSGGDLLGMVSCRATQALRGLFKQALSLRGARFPIFAGKNLGLRSMRMFRAGRAVILEDNVSIWALSKEGVVLGDNVTVARNAMLQASGVMARPGVGIRIGDHVAIGALSFLGGQGGIEIGRNTIMGPGVKIFSEGSRVRGCGGSHPASRGTARACNYR